MTFNDLKLKRAACKRSFVPLRAFSVYPERYRAIVDYLDEAGIDHTLF